MIIGLCGYKGSGKTELSKRVMKLSNEQFVRIGFSDPIYLMLHAMGVPEEVIKDKARWEEPLDILCGKTLRHACDTLGTDWGQNHIGKNVWVYPTLRIARELEAQGSDVVIDNVRFMHEVHALRDIGAHLIGFYRTNMAAPSKPPYADSFISNIRGQYCVMNFHNRGVDPEADASKLLGLFELLKSRSASAQPTGRTAQ